MRIINRYFTFEILKCLFVVFSVLFFIAFSHRFIQLLSHITTGDIASSFLLPLLGLFIPDLIAFLLPLSIYLAILLTYSRCFADQEIPALLACGVSWLKLIKWSMLVGLFVSILVGFISLYLEPKVERYKSELMSTQDPNTLLKTIVPGRFNMILNNKVVFYVEGFENNRSHLKRVFIAELPTHSTHSKNGWSIINAQAGQVVYQDDAFYLELLKGSRYNGVPGERDFSIIEFERYGRHIQSVDTHARKEPHRILSSYDLLKSESKKEQAELQWRLALPLSVPILILIAIPLSHVSPRDSRFARFLPALILYLFYFNFLSLSRRWIINEMIPSYIGLWWVHSVMLFLAAYLNLIKSNQGQFIKLGFKRKR